MLRSVSPNISIITNWGCQQKCWFCIWQHHPLKNVNLPMDWKKLEQFISDNRDKKKFSISGGGDCLFEYRTNVHWWTRIFELAHKYNMVVDVHSRQKLYEDIFWRRINKLVITSDNLSDDIYYFDYIREFCKLRIVHVATEYTDVNEIENFIKFSEKSYVQFTIKQLSFYDDKGMFEKLKRHYSNEVYFLEEGDYNKYFFPDNSIGNEFINLKAVSDD